MKLFTYTLLFLLFSISIHAQTMNVNYKSVELNNSHLSYSVKASYPQVNFGPDALMGVRGIAGDINTFFDTTVSSVIKEFEHQVSELPVKSLDGHGSSLDISSEAYVTNGSLLCSEVTVFTYLVQMAHPNTVLTTYNFKVNGEGPLTISSLFKSGSDYLNFISSYCIKELTAKAVKEGYSDNTEMINSGASPDEKNFSNWTVKDDSLNIIFNPYQAGPYVMGIQSVSIPLNELTSMISSDGALSFMLR